VLEQSICIRFRHRWMRSRCRLLAPISNSEGNPPCSRATVCHQSEHQNLDNQHPGDTAPRISHRTTPAERFASLRFASLRFASLPPASPFGFIFGFRHCAEFGFCLNLVSCRPISRLQKKRNNGTFASPNNPPKCANIS